MQIVIISTRAQKEELSSNEYKSAAELIWITELAELKKYPQAEAVIDLLFENDKQRIQLLGDQEDRLVIINSVADTVSELAVPFVRINGWISFLKGNKIESSCQNEALKQKTEEVLLQFGKVTEWVPDASGFIMPRIVSMIINEAYFALVEGVATPQDIDTAMKLGTNYPYGPIEWGNRIGLQNIVRLLQKLAVTQPRYTPAPLLVQEAARVM